MYLLFDIGGTKTRVAFSPDGENFEDPEVFPTPENFDDGILAIKKAAKNVSKGREIKVACGGIAGSLNKEKTETLILPNIKSWEKKPIVKELKEALGILVFLENDAALVGLGEAVHGAGKGSKIVAYITISTGVGGVRIVDKKIDANSWGFEPGHQIINFSKEGTKSLSSFISGKWIKKIYGKEPKEIRDQKVWLKISKILAYGIYNVILFWSPDVVVLGGGMMNLPGISLKKVKLSLKNTMKIFPKYSEIKKASLGDFGGLFGALVYIDQKLNNIKENEKN
jgi:glucokinase